MEIFTCTWWNPSYEDWNPSCLIRDFFLLFHSLSPNMQHHKHYFSLQSSYRNSYHCTLSTLKTIDLSQTPQTLYSTKSELYTLIIPYHTSKFTKFLPYLASLNGGDRVHPLTSFFLNYCSKCRLWFLNV